MNWVSLLIPLIVLIVWILSNLGRQEEPPRRGGNRPRRPIPGQRPAEVARPRRSADEVDRFLASLRQKRQQEEEQSSSQQQTPKPAPVPPRRPAPQPPPIPSQAPTPQPEYPLPLEYDIPSRDDEGTLRRTVQVVPKSETQIRLPDLGSLALSSQRPKPSRATKKLVEMLRDPDSLQTAFLMREVLSPPVSKRPGSLPVRRG